MSRTDHHRPWQIRADDARGWPAYFWHNDWAHAREGRCTDGCGWTLPHHALDQPPAWYTHAVWHRPERQRTRLALRALAAEWNANGDLADGDVPSWQHRHGAAWHWL